MFNSLDYQITPREKLISLIRTLAIVKKEILREWKCTRELVSMDDELPLLIFVCSHS